MNKLKKISHIIIKLVCLCLPRFYFHVRRSLIDEMTFIGMDKSLRWLCKENYKCGDVTVSYADSHRKKVLLLTNGFTLTGAPSAMLFLGKYFIDQGFDLLFLSPSKGKLQDEITSKNIPSAVVEELLYTNLVAEYSRLFDLVICATINTARIVYQLTEINTPTLWWIHESDEYYSKIAVRQLPKSLPEHIHVYCGGDRAAATLHKYRSYKSNILLYPDPKIRMTKCKSSIIDSSKLDDKIVFMTVGNKCRRKGQDILLDALSEMPEDLLQKCCFIFIGKDDYKNEKDSKRFIELYRKHPGCIIDLNETDRESLYSLYFRMNCLICPSRDDPMPIVVTDAMQLGKLIVCSEYTGSAKLLGDANGALIFYNNDPAELKNCITDIICNISKYDEMCNNAAAVYERYFSESVFAENMNVVLHNILKAKR